MTESDDDLAFRKKLLVARSTLCRLKIRHEADAIRESLRGPRVAAAAARTAAGQSTLLLLALQVLGEARAARLLAFAGAVMTFLRGKPEAADAPPPTP